jgi:hypothetical protein
VSALPAVASTVAAIRPEIMGQAMLIERLS